MPDIEYQTGVVARTTRVLMIIVYIMHNSMVLKLMPAAKLNFVPIILKLWSKPTTPFKPTKPFNRSKSIVFLLRLNGFVYTTSYN